MNGPYWGKYSGIVTNNDDPNRLGRIRARVVDVLGDLEMGWATPCFPLSGRSMGWFAVPPVGAQVWIEFEAGDPERPLWTGCAWESRSDMPSDLQSDPVKKVLLQSAGGHRILFDDTPGSGGIRIETSGGQKIELSSDGILLDNGSGQTIKLGSANTSINNGALEVS